MKKTFLAFVPLLIWQIGIYNFSLPNAAGGTINISDYQGKKILIVNTAAGSEHVNQYGGLEQLYQLYKDSLVIIAVPSNSFGNQQGSDTSIYEQVNRDYIISYLLAGETAVAGDSIAPLYQWLTELSGNGVMNHDISTDFEKFLIDGSGNLIGVYSASVEPMSGELRDAIEGKDN